MLMVRFIILVDMLKKTIDANAFHEFKFEKMVACVTELVLTLIQR